MNAPTLRVEARFKNARLYNAIVAQSVYLSSDARLMSLQIIRPVRAWCKTVGISYNLTCDLLNLRLGPLLKCRPGHTAEIRPVCTQIAAALGEDVLWLFPEDLYRIEWPRYLAADTHHQRFVALSAARGVVLELPPGQDLAIEQRELLEHLQSSLATLTPREEKVIKMRFGIDDNIEHSFDEVAQTFAVTPERVRQIEAKALRKLRHPHRSKALEPFLWATTRSSRPIP